MTSPIRQTRMAVFLVTAGLALGACTTTAATSSSSSAPPPTGPSAAPTIVRPDGPPPEALRVTELVDTDGPQAEEGDRLRVHYIGMTWSSGDVFAQTWDGAPFEFVLGGDGEVPGWDRGIRGMHVGERREIVIPPGQGYGDRDVPGVPPGETLVFVVDLLAIVPT